MSEGGEYGLDRFCEELEGLISREQEQSALLGEVQVLFKRLLPDRRFVGDFMEKMVSDNAFLAGRIGTIDRNDLMLYLSPKGSFSIRLFVSLPGVEYPIHDHGSWGVVGAYVSRSYEIKYRRYDDGSVDGYAQIEEEGRKVLSPGDTTPLAPYSIHQMGSADDETALTLNVYGRPVRKGFIQCFVKEQNSVCKLVTPKLEKRLFAIKALGAIGGDVARGPIEKAFHDSHPLVRWESILAMEKVDKEGWLALLKQAVSDPSEEIRNRARAIMGQQ